MDNICDSELPLRGQASSARSVGALPACAGAQHSFRFRQSFYMPWMFRLPVQELTTLSRFIHTVPLYTYMRIIAPMTTVTRHAPSRSPTKDVNSIHCCTWSFFQPVTTVRLHYTVCARTPLNRRFSCLRVCRHNHNYTSLQHE